MLEEIRGDRRRGVTAPATKNNPEMWFHLEIIRGFRSLIGLERPPETFGDPFEESSFPGHFIRIYFIALSTCLSSVVLDLCAVVPFDVIYALIKHLGDMKATEDANGIRQAAATYQRPPPVCDLPRTGHNELRGFETKVI